MKAVAALWANDLRNVLRDRTIGLLVVVPLLFALAIVWGLPRAEAELPALVPYRALVVALFCLLASSFPGFVLAFLLLDERDEGLFPVFRVLPISTRRLLLARLALATALALLYPLVILAAARGIAPHPWPAVLLLAALSALLAPVAVLAVVVLASNKIEGLAVIKGLFPLILLPVAAFVLDSRWADLLGVLPSYWVYRAFTAPSGAQLVLAAAVGAVVHLALAAALLRRFRDRVFA